MQNRTLEANFLEDWRLQILKELQDMGFQPDQIEDVRDLSRRYLNVLWRRIGIGPRKVLVAAGIVCPPEMESGYKNLLRKVETGEDLNPHLSPTFAI